MEPVKTTSFLGMNSLLPESKLSVGDGSFVRNAVNVDFTDAGTIKRRKGVENILAGVDCHSFWTNGIDSFMVDDDQLYRLSESIAGVVSESISAVTPRLQMSYVSDGLEVRASNGVERLRISGNTVSDWSVPTPMYSPFLSVQANSGNIPAGVVQVCVSYMNAAGEEGATTVPVAILVGDNSAIIIDAIPHEAGFTTILYASQPNDVFMFKVAEPPGVSHVMAVKPSEGPQPVGLLLAPMPAGHIVRFHNSRLLVASGPMLYYSEPSQLGLYDPTRNYIPFPEPITMIEPCGKGGIYVSADKTYWFPGDIAQSDPDPVLPYRAVLGTSGKVPNANSVWWMSERGMVLGTPDGQVKNLQEQNVSVDPALVGASLYREQDGMKQMVASLFGPQSTVVAASSFMDAEIIRKETQL